MDARKAIVSLLPLLLGAGIMNLGFGLLASLLGLRADMEGFPLPVVGAIMAAYFGGYLLGTWWVPLLVQRLGHVRVFALVVALAVLSTVLHVLWVEPGPWLVLRALGGICFAGFSLVVESWLNARVVNAVRGTVMSAYMILILGGAASGQLLLLVADASGSLLFLLVAAAFALALPPVLLALPPLYGPVPAPLGVSLLWRLAPAGVVGAFSNGLLAATFGSLGALYARQAGFPPWGIAVFMFGYIGGGLLGQWPLGRLSDRVDRRWVLLGAGAGLTLLALAGLADVVRIPEVGIVHGVLFGALLLPVYALSIAHVNDGIHASQVVPASAALLRVFGLGALIGPVLAAEAMARLGPAGLFMHVFLVGGVSTLVMACLSPPAPWPGMWRCVRRPDRAQ
ncbi:MAG: MFS transporter [Magnetococcus sp. WYHC-3]